MEKKNMPEAFEKIWVKLRSNKYVIAVLLLGLVLILLPKADGESTREVSQNADTQEFSLDMEEKRIALALKEIEGVGDAKVVLTLKTGAEAVMAVDTQQSEKTDENGQSRDLEQSYVVISKGSSTQTPVTVKTVYPEYQGALIVAEGADNAEIKLRLTEAVSGLTGLTFDKITVLKMKSS